MITILRVGTIDPETIQFHCKYCDSIFLATNDDYTIEDEENPVIISYSIECPVCHKKIKGHFYQQNDDTAVITVV